MKWSVLIISFALLACSGEKTNESDETIVPEAHIELESDGLNVAFLVMDGVYNTELTAPMDIFHHTKFRDSIKAMNVFIIADDLDLITSFEGLKIQPDYSYLEDHPEIDILVVPSAEGHLDKDLQNEKMIQFVQETAKSAMFVASHCDGAFVLAEAGLLDGVECTTFPADVKLMRENYDKPIIHDSVIFVHDGKYITSAGGAKSFEASLYLVELLYGKENADQIAEGMVIDWDLDQVPHLVIE